MKKLTKTLFTLGLLLTLAACGGTSSSANPSSSSEAPASSEAVVTHTVLFYSDMLGTEHTRQTVNHGALATRPTDPVREGYSFEDWYTDLDLEELYNFATPVNADLELFPKYLKDYTPDTRNFILTGTFENSAYPEEWPETTTNEDLYFTVDDDSNLFTIEVELGFQAEVAIKVNAAGWDPQYGYNHIKTPDETIIARGGGFAVKNIQIKKSGAYTITLESDLEEVTVTRTGDAVGTGVTPDTEILDMYLVGDMNSWGDNVILDLVGKDYWLKNIYVKTGEIFRFRLGTSWGTTYGFTHAAFDASATDTLTEHTKDNNFVAAENGIFTFKISPATEPATGYVVNVYFNSFEDGFEVKGGFNGWGDGVVMTKVEVEGPAEVASETSEEPVDPNPIPTDLHYRTVAMTFAANDEYKVKAMLTWEISWGNETGGNLVAATAGSFMVDMVLTINANRSVTAVITLVAAV